MTADRVIPPTAAWPAAKKLIVIGASAGAVDALSAILPTLPAGYPFPILVVIHVPPDRASALPDIFAKKSRLNVKEAEDKEPLCAGTVYFAPPDYHLLVEPDGRASLSNEEQVHYSRPSIDVLFESAADSCGEAVVGIVLTGANDDGAAGLRAIHAAGGTAVVQEPAEAMAEAMPLAALAACPDARVLTLESLSVYLRELAPVQ